MRLALALFSVVALLWPDAASACAVCMGGQEEDVATAFIVTTGLLTFLPLGMAAAFVWYLRRRIRQQRDDQSSIRGYVSSSPVPAPAKAPAAIRLTADQSPLSQ